MKPVQPLDTLPLFSRLGPELVALLRSLDADDWSRPTACALWSVKDIAAHLLDTDIRRLSFQRDGLVPLAPETPIESYQDLVGFLNQLNADWVRSAQRISPILLTELLAFIGPKVCELLESLAPEGTALFPVAWAGDQSSLNWFDIAREYTEKWLHQQQIRDAVGRPGLTSREWLYPVLDTFMRALPHVYRETSADEGASLTVTIKGEAGGDWSLVRTEGAWQLFHGVSATGLAHTTLDQDTAWRLFTKGIDADTARHRLQIKGDESLGSKILHMVAVMA